MKLRRDAFQAIADPTRRAILLLLAIQPLTAGSIASNFDSSRPTISKHIKILSECDLVQHNQTGRKIYYQVNTSVLTDIDNWLMRFRNIWESRFNNLDNVLINLKKNE